MRPFSALVRRCFGLGFFHWCILRHWSWMSFCPLNIRWHTEPLAILNVHRYPSLCRSKCGIVGMLAGGNSKSLHCHSSHNNWSLHWMDTSFTILFRSGFGILCGSRDKWLSNWLIKTPCWHWVHPKMGNPWNGCKYDAIINFLPVERVIAGYFCFCLTLVLQRVARSSHLTPF